jgi:hypothetical protein
VPSDGQLLGSSFRTKFGNEGPISSRLLGKPRGRPEVSVTIFNLWQHEQGHLLCAKKGVRGWVHSHLHRVKGMLPNPGE